MKDTRKVDGRPSFQWYPDDWLAEPGLRMCDLAARGLWIDLLCHMFKMENRGQLRIASDAMTVTDIAHLVGRPVAEVQAALNQLIKFRVCETADDGTIYSRRMVREERLRHNKVMAGKKGAHSRWHGRVMRKDGSSSSTPSPTSSSHNNDVPSEDSENLPQEHSSKSEFSTRMEEVLSAWKDLAEHHGLPTVRRLNPTRRKSLLARVKDSEWWASWREALEKIPKSDFLTGRTKEQWKANFDFFIRPRTVDSILEGKYDSAPGGLRF